MKVGAKRLTAAILVLAMVIPLGACGGRIKTRTGKISPEKTEAKVNGITVNVGPYVLTDETKLTVSKLPGEKDPNGDWKADIYDINIEGITEMQDFITIRIPYNESFCKKGEDPSKCVGAKYKNEETGLWEDVIFEVDAEAKELIIHTDHLSTYGVFRYRDEGKRKAHVAYVYEDVENISFISAKSSLQELVDKKGAIGDEAVSLGAELLSLYCDAASGLSSFAGDVDTGISTIDGLIQVATLGNPAIDASLAGQFNEILGKMGQAAAAVKIGAIILNPNASDEDILGLYKDAGSFLASKLQSKALGLACIGVFVMDYSLNKLIEESRELKKKKVNEVYLFFNDEFQAGKMEFGEWYARSLKDWRQTIIDILEAHETDEAAMTALKNEINRYANIFWTLNAVDQHVVITNIERLKQQRGAYLFPHPDAKHREEMTREYIAHLYDRLHPVITSVKNYFQKKAIDTYIKELHRAKDHLNQIIKFNIKENVPLGKESYYDGYIVRFAPLSDLAEKDSWTGKIYGGGITAMDFTLLGYINAGRPTELHLFPPGADPDVDEPETIKKFTMTTPITEVVFAPAAPSFEQLVGQYKDGTHKILQVYVSEALQKDIENSESSKLLQELGCDDDGEDYYTALKKDIGEESEYPFTIAQKDETGGTFSSYTGLARITYNQESGQIKYTLVEDNKIVAHGTLTASFAKKNTEVVIDGVLTKNLGVSEDHFYMLVDIHGTKPLK